MNWKSLAVGAALSIGAVPTAFAGVFTGDLYFTYFTSPPNNVDKITYNYDDTALSFTASAVTPIASRAGADGIIFDAGGNLLVGGQGSNLVYQITTGGAAVSQASSNTPSFHLTLDPSGTKVYTSDFGGNLQTLALTPTLNLRIPAQGARARQ